MKISHDGKYIFDGESVTCSTTTGEKVTDLSGLLHTIGFYAPLNLRGREGGNQDNSVFSFAVLSC